MSMKWNQSIRIVTVFFLMSFMGFPVTLCHAQMDSTQLPVASQGQNLQAKGLEQTPEANSEKKDSLADHKAIVFEVNGDVRILKNSDSEWKKAEKGMIIEAGDQILTGKKSHIEFSYDEFFLNIARIEEKTKAEFRTIEPTDLYMEDGTIFNALDGLGGPGHYKISTPTAVAAVRGTEFFAMDGAMGTLPSPGDHSIDVSLEGGSPINIDEGLQFNLDSGIVEGIPAATLEHFQEARENLLDNVDPNLRQEGMQQLGIEPAVESQNENPEGEDAQENVEQKEGDENKPAGGNPPSDGSGGGQVGDAEGAVGNGGTLAQEGEAPIEAPVDQNVPAEQPAIGEAPAQPEGNSETLVDAVIDTALAPPPVLQGEEGQNIPGANIEKEGEGEGEQGQKPQGQGQEGEGQNLPENFQPGQGPGPFPGGEGNLTPGPQFDMSHMDMNSLGQFMMLGGAMENFDPNMIGPTGPEMMTHDFGAVFTNLFEGFQGPEGFSPGQFQNFTEGIANAFEGFAQNFGEGGQFPSFFGGDAFAMDGPSGPVGMSPEFMTFIAENGENLSQFSNEFDGNIEFGTDGTHFIEGDLFNPAALGLDLNDLASGIAQGDLDTIIADAILSQNNAYYFLVLGALESDLSWSEKQDLLNNVVTEILRGGAVLANLDGALDNDLERITGVRYFKDPYHSNWVSANYDKILDDVNHSGYPPLQVSPTDGGGPDDFLIVDVAACKSSDPEDAVGDQSGAC